MILSDNETKVDLLNNEAIAKTIVSLIKDSKEQPISIGIHGDWGAGKSSILEMVENEVKLASSVSGKKYSCIRFNGWKHQGFEDSKVALMSSIISELVLLETDAPFALKVQHIDEIEKELKRTMSRISDVIGFDISDIINKNSKEVFCY